MAATIRTFTIEDIAGFDNFKLTGSSSPQIRPYEQPVKPPMRPSPVIFAQSAQSSHAEKRGGACYPCIGNATFPRSCYLIEQGMSPLFFDKKLASAAL
jgi:hypothetical protein